MRKTELRVRMRIALATAHKDFKAKEHPSILDMCEYMLDKGKYRGTTSRLSVPACVQQQEENPPDTTHEKPGE